MRPTVPPAELLSRCYQNNNAQSVSHNRNGRHNNNSPLTVNSLGNQLLDGNTVTIRQTLYRTLEFLCFEERGRRLPTWDDVASDNDRRLGRANTNWPDEERDEV